MANPSLRHYSEPLKHYVVTEIEAGRLSIAQAKRQFGIGGNNTIYRWLRLLGNHTRTATNIYVQMKNEPDPLAQRDQHIRELQQEKQALESALAQSQLTILTLESTLAVTERHLGRDGKKNSGSKPSTTPESR